jgi:hypothetical protein
MTRTSTGLIVAVMAILGLAFPAAAQRSPPPRAALGVARIAGSVADSAGHPVSDAVVEAHDTSGRVLKTVRTAPDGKFVLGELSALSAYGVAVRRIGFEPFELPSITLPDTGLVLRVVLKSLAALLPAIENSATVPRDYRATAADVEKTHNDFVSILQYLRRWKPRMLSDGYKLCGDPPLRIYMNGQRAVSWDLDVHLISDVAEMRYFDCWQKDQKLRNVLAIDLKPGISP